MRVISSGIFTLALSLIINCSIQAQSRPEPVRIANPQQQIPLGVVGGVNGALFGADGHQVFLGKTGPNHKSPFLYNDWTSGKVTMQDGKIFSGLDLLYNQVEQTLLFSPDKKSAMTFVDTVISFTLLFTNNNGISEERNFRKYPISPFQGMFFELIAMGKMELLRQSKVTLVEENEPGQLYKTKQYKEVSKGYFIRVDNKIEKIKKIDKLLIFLKDTDGRINKFIESNRINLNKENDLIELVEFLNRG